MMKKMLVTLVFVSNLNLFSQNYFSTNMDEIIIKDKAENENIEFSKKEIEKAKNIYLPDILKYEPEINVTRRAITGDNADMLSIRGLSGSRILLNLNGRSLNAAGVVGGYYNDFSIIPVDNIEKIQVIKGGGDLKYGNNALGGVINIITKEPKETAEISVFSGFSAGKDIDYMYNERIGISKKYHKLAYLFSTSYQKNDEYLWNNDFEAKNLGGFISYDMPYDSKIYFNVQYTNTKRGFIINNRKSTNPNSPLFYEKIDIDYPLAFGDTLNPYGGNVSQPGPNSYWIKEKTLFDMGYKIPIKDWFAEFKLYKNFENRFEYNYSSHITSPTYPNPDGTLIFKRKVESDKSWGANLDLSREFEKNNLNSGFEYKYLGYGDINIYYIDMSYGCFGTTCIGGPASQSADVYAGYLKDEYRVSDKINLNAGIRYDIYNVNEENNSGVKEFKEKLLSASIGLKYNISKTNELFLTAYSKYRTPTMPEVYWWSNNQLGYSGSLKSEDNKALEFAYKMKIKNNFFEISAYNYDIENYIMFRFDPKRGTYNIDNVKIYGGSFKYYANYNNLNPYLNLSFQKTKKGKDFYDPAKLSDDLDYSPKFKLNAGFESKFGKNISLITNYRYNDVSHTIYVWQVGPTKYYKLVNMKSYDVIDLELKYNIKNVTASIYADNIFNERYEEKFGYPMNGRILGGSITLRFK